MQPTSSAMFFLVSAMACSLPAAVFALPINPSEFRLSTHSSIVSWISFKRITVLISKSQYGSVKALEAFHDQIKGLNAPTHAKPHYQVAIAKHAEYEDTAQALASTTHQRHEAVVAEKKLENAHLKALRSSKDPNHKVAKARQAINNHYLDVLCDPSSANHKIALARQAKKDAFLVALHDPLNRNHKKALALQKKKDKFNIELTCNEAVGHNKAEWLQGMKDNDALALVDSNHPDHLLAKIGESSKNDAILKEYGWKPAPKSASKF